MLPGLSPSVPLWKPAVEPFSVSYRNSYADINDLTTYTFAAADLGTATPSRLVVVGAMAFGGTSDTVVASATINGVAATIVAGANISVVSGSVVAAVFYAAVPAGATGDIVVTFSGAKVRAAIGVWAVYGSSGAHTDADEFSSASATAFALSALTVPTDGVGIVFAGTANVATTGFTWTNATERSDAVVELNNRYSGADTLVAGTATITGTVSAALAGAVAGLAFGP